LAGFWGADTAQLHTLAGSLRTSGERFTSLAQQLQASLDNTTWKGRDGEEFRRNWQSDHRQALSKCASLLLEQSKALESHAKEQERASHANSGTTVNAGSGKDRPGEPTGRDKHIPIADPIPEGDDDLQADKIEQGNLADCWFLAGLGSVVQDDPDFIREHMERNPDGSYTVTFYDDGEPVEVTVEASRIEASATDPNNDPNFATIYEKAAAEYFGGDYSDIEYDDPQRALEAITGKEAETEGELSFDEIQDRLNDGPVVMSSESGGDWNPFTSNDGDVDDDRIVENHVYVVSEIKDGKIHLINPWGPDGGTGSDGNTKAGDIWLTEEEYRQNFESVSSVPSTKDK
jgi:uncharacterized protein YukE